jgi:hypothetical protein
LEWPIRERGGASVLLCVLSPIGSRVLPP